MGRLIGKLNEGSLLRRTLLYVGTFVIGSVAFISLVSVLLVSAAKAVLPSHATESAEAKDDGDGNEGPSPSRPPIRAPRNKPVRGLPPSARGRAPD